jgi:CDP-diacylglycerol--serine O-phosphatidyltransferase
VRKIAILPTMLTLGNAVCGFAAIAYASKINGKPETVPFYALSGWLIIAAMVFDLLDGYVARLSRSASNFGAQLDSLCDAISFGAAPAFLLLRLGPSWEKPFWHQTLAVIASLYVVCAVLRLARFTVETTPDPASHKRFRGLPSPAAAGCLASLAVMRGTLVEKWNLDARLFNNSTVAWATLFEAWATLGALAVALLMVSRVSYPHLTKQFLRGRRHFNHIVQLVLAVFIVVLIQELALVLIFWAYTLGVFCRHLWVRSLRSQTLRPSAPGLEDALPH